MLDFCEANELDEAVLRTLREQPLYLQRQVMDKYVTGKNKSAVVMKRIRELQSSPPDLVAVFCAENDLDAEVEQALRAQPPQVREAVMQHYVTGRNKSAVFMCRLRDAAAAQATSAPPPLPAPLPAGPGPGTGLAPGLAVAAFVRDNRLDGAAARALREQPADVQGRVMEKYVTGNNPSAVVMRRIRDTAGC